MLCFSHNVNVNDFSAELPIDYSTSLFNSCPESLIEMTETNQYKNAFQ